MNKNNQPENNSKHPPLRELVKVDPEKCVNCHQCISVCPSKYCNDGSGDYVKVDPELCIGCGACITICSHNARYGCDDFEQFIQALKENKKVVAVVAPSIASNFPNAYLNFNGWLKSIGVKASFDASFGAELTVKSYLEAVKRSEQKHIIAQPCPAIVGYIENYHPELLKYLAPADSPMMHTMRMIREFYKKWSDAEFVIISPCYAKKREFDEVGIGNYNVTFKSFNTYFSDNNIILTHFNAEPYDNPPAERAVLFSTPGGLLRTALREVPDAGSSIRKIEGRHTIYHYLDSFEDTVKKGVAPLIVDCLNCEAGCNSGPGTLNGEKSFDEIEALIEKRNKAAQQEYLKEAGFLGKKRALSILHKNINSKWKPGLYNRKYVDRSFSVKQKIKIPSLKQQDEIDHSMYKFKESDFLNCCSCGYGSCEQMTVAIFNGLNKPSNCRHFQEIDIVKTQERLAQNSLENRKNIIKEVQASFQDAVNSLMSISSASEEMSATINEVATSSEKAHYASTEMSIKASAISTLMEKLGAMAREINVIVKTIADISAQTKLLAINASIESATAGDAGRGFTVVANEVKELARKASSASDDIKEKIQGVQASIANAVTDVENVTVLIKNLENIVTGIATSIKEQSSVTQDIAANIARTLSNVKNGISHVAKIGDEGADSAVSGAGSEEIKKI